MFYAGSSARVPQQGINVRPLRPPVQAQFVAVNDGSTGAVTVRCPTVKVIGHLHAFARRLLSPSPASFLVMQRPELGLATQRKLSSRPVLLPQDISNTQLRAHSAVPSAVLSNARPEPRTWTAATNPPTEAPPPPSPHTHTAHTHHLFQRRPASPPTS